MIGHKYPLKHSFGSFHFASISSFQFFTSPPIPTHPTPQMTHPTKKKKSMNNYVQMVPFQNYLLLMDARRATGKPTGSLLSLSPSLLALSPMFRTGLYIHGYNPFMVFLISIVKYGTNLSIGVLSAFYAQNRLHQPSAELHSPSNKIYCAGVKLNPVVQKMSDLTCLVMFPSLVQIIPK